MTTTVTLGLSSTQTRSHTDTKTWAATKSVTCPAYMVTVSTWTIYQTEAIVRHFTAFSHIRVLHDGLPLRDSLLHAYVASLYGDGTIQEVAGDTVKVATRGILSSSGYFINIYGKDISVPSFFDLQPASGKAGDRIRIVTKAPAVAVDEILFGGTLITRGDSPEQFQYLEDDGPLEFYVPSKPQAGTAVAVVTLATESISSDADDDNKGGTARFTYTD